MEDKTSKASAISISNQATDTENNSQWKMQVIEDNSEDGCRSEVLNLFQDAPSASESTLNKKALNPYPFKGFTPLVKGISEKCLLKDLSSDKEAKEIETTNNKGIQVGLLTKSAQIGPDVAGLLPEKLNHPITKGTVDKDIQMTETEQPGGHVISNTTLTISSQSEFPANSGISCSHQPFPVFPPFAHFPGNHDAYRSFVNVPSAFSSLIASTLLQNPAVHAAACLAASYWPSAGADASLDSTAENMSGEIPARHMNPTPGMAAIAAATVAAATAWWATQGLLPVFPPVHPGFAFAPAPMATMNSMDPSRVPDEGKDKNSEALQNFMGANQQNVEAEQSEAVNAEHRSKRMVSSSDSDENRRKDQVGTDTENLKPSQKDEFQDPDDAKSKKKMDRSSCGSNTTSSSEEIELLEKQIEENTNNLIPTDNRRTRSTMSMNESWKEVSEEGRIAFQALFSRHVLPQSFSPPHPKNSVVKRDLDKEANNELPVDLNVATCPVEPNDSSIPECHDSNGNCSLTSENMHFRLKSRRTGFKPYKRCSVEAKESRSPTGEEAGNKRIRLEGETSI